MARVRRPSSTAWPIALLTAACGANPDPNPPSARCGAEFRPALSCESEVSYDARLASASGTLGGLGFSAGTEVKALREIDAATARYVAASRRLCEEYNACVLDRETYATRSENLRRSLMGLPPLLERIRTAPDDEARRQALAAAYEAVVPAEDRSELTVELAALARRPGEATLRPMPAGTRLPTESRVAFAVRPSRPAHVYLFQRVGTGRLNVLFPDARLPMKNPLGAELRIPGGDATFRLDAEDVGPEAVYLVASLDPLPDPESVAAAVAPVGDAGGCKTRALELDETGAIQVGACARPRGLVLDDPGGAPVLRVKAEAADRMVVQVFRFEHTR